jgi:hypothetical protein
VPFYLLFPAIALAYWPVALAFAAHRQLLFMLFDSLAIVFSVAFGVTLLPALKLAFVQRYMTVRRPHMLTLGIFFWLLGAGIRFCWVWVWRLKDEPADFLNQLGFGWGLWLYVIGAVSLMIAYRIEPRAGDAAVIPGYWLKIGILFGVGAMAFLSVLGLYKYWYG